ncbi:MAG TPA: SRPBCC domain-containing protein [Herpetosiphonaceae bacterium]
MKSFSAGIDIDATPAAIWAVLVDTANWPEFDPYSERIEGQPALDETITVFSTPAPGRAFPVKITTLEQPRQMAWTNAMPLGVLKSVRSHTICPNGSGSRFEISEVVSGPMLAVLSGALPDLTEPFAAFCSGSRHASKTGSTPSC